MNSLARRLTVLERIAPASAPSMCPACGRLPNGRLPDGAGVTFRLSFDDDGDETPDHCASCGAKLVYRLSFDSELDS